MVAYSPAMTLGALEQTPTLLQAMPKASQLFAQPTRSLNGRAKPTLRRFPQARPAIGIATLIME